MNSPQTNYSSRSWIAAAAVLLVLIVVSFIPPQTIGGIKLRRANIFADLFSFNDKSASASELFDESEFRVDMKAVAQQIKADSLPPKTQVSFEWTLPGEPIAYDKAQPDTLQLRPAAVPIEEFDSTGFSMRTFYDKLINAKQPVHIAVLGDSFIEGDILTADLRERMQEQFGGTPGGGPGFAPISSPLTAFRRTIKTQSKGWNAYNIMQRKMAPQTARDNFFVSGWACLPTAGASTRWEMTDFRRMSDECTSAQLFFLSPINSVVEVVVNDTVRKNFTVKGDPSVRQVLVKAPRIRSFEFRVKSGVDGFVGYGCSFGANGIILDNFSVRSNNGQAMFWTNPTVNAQINDFVKYDLVILQYGLNIMQQGVHNYQKYGEQIDKMIAYVRQCFPGAAVLVMGVSDRSAKSESGMAPMDALPYMTACQRQAAQRAHAAFWNTYNAMRNNGGMAQYVANGWAGKDYTHINYGGGRRIAEALFEAIKAASNNLRMEQRVLNTQRRLRNRPIVDTTGHAAIRRNLQPEPTLPILNDTLEK